MELDEMKLTWQKMEQLLQSQNALLRKTEVNMQLGKVRRGLRPLYWGQMFQILLGILLMVLAVSYWTENREIWYRLASGIIVHAYAVVAIVLAAITISKISKIDYSAPVTTIQKQLTNLRSFYILNGMLTGLTWWLLWIPVMAVLFGLLGHDLYANAPGFVLWCSVFGTVGLIGTLLLNRWAHQPAYSKIGKRLDDLAAGGSLKKTQKMMLEIERFETE